MWICEYEMEVFLFVEWYLWSYVEIGINYSCELVDWFWIVFDEVLVLIDWYGELYGDLNVICILKVINYDMICGKLV